MAINPVGSLSVRVEIYGLRATARELKCSAPYLLDIINGRRQPGPKILKALGLERTISKTVTYRKAKP
jgi:hypothetical protein